MEYMEIAKYIGTFLLGLGTGLSISVVTKKNASKNRFVQKNNTVTGDQAGRDISKK